HARRHTAAKRIGAERILARGRTRLAQLGDAGRQILARWIVGIERGPEEGVERDGGGERGTELAAPRHTRRKTDFHTGSNGATAMSGWCTSTLVLDGSQIQGHSSRICRAISRIISMRRDGFISRSAASISLSREGFE